MELIQLITLLNSNQPIKCFAKSRVMTEKREPHSCDLATYYEDR